MNKLNRDLAVYVLVRTDIPSMNPGKAMAQVHHAGVQMVSQASHQMASQDFKQRVKDYIADGTRAGAIGFNTTITLGANRSQIEMILDKASMQAATGSVNFNYGQVIDPSYPFVVNREVWEWANSLGTDLESVSEDLNADQVLVTRKEVTCVWFLGDRNDPEFKKLFEGLKLHE